jgi:hypothetical protein
MTATVAGLTGVARKGECVRACVNNGRLLHGRCPYVELGKVVHVLRAALDLKELLVIFFMLYSQEANSEYTK